jgi:hypothetical protein
MTHTTLDHREPSYGDLLEYTGHEQLAEQFRAALKGTPEPAQPNPEQSDA